MEAEKAREIRNCLNELEKVKKLKDAIQYKQDFSSMHITVTARNNNYSSGVEEIEYYAPEELKDSFREFIEKRYQELEEKLKQF